MAHAAFLHACPSTACPRRAPSAAACKRSQKYLNAPPLAAGTPTGKKRGASAAQLGRERRQSEAHRKTDRCPSIQPGRGVAPSRRYTHALFAPPGPPPPSPHSLEAPPRTPPVKDKEGTGQGAVGEADLHHHRCGRRSFRAGRPRWRASPRSACCRTAQCPSCICKIGGEIQ